MNPSVAARRLLKRSSVLADRVLPTPDGITVLIYHQVGGGSDSLVDIEPAMFEAHLEHLVAHHRVLTLDEAVEELTARSAETGARRGVVITFDDGTADFVDVVAPILERHRVPATLYAATHFIDTGEEFPWGAAPASWQGLRDVLSTGLVTVGSHTHTHWLLDRLAPEVLAGDLDRSIDLIGAHLGVAPIHFAYPKALPGSPSSEIAVRRRFRTAALAGSRVNRPGRADLHRLWRTPLQRTDSSQVFERKADGGMRLEGEVRSLTARVRYRGAAQ